MNRFLMPLGAFALLVVVLAIGIKRSPDKGIIQSVLINKPAPAFNLRPRTRQQQIQPAHYRQAIRVFARTFKRTIVAEIFHLRRHQHRAIDARGVHLL